MTIDNQTAQVIFARLAREQSGLTDIDRDLMATLEGIIQNRCGGSEDLQDGDGACTSGK